MRFSGITAIAAALLAAGCAQIEPSPIERADGTIQFCPNPYNRHHVLMAARRYCAPEPAQPVGFEACPDDDLVDGRVFACRYNPGYDPLQLEEVRAPDAPPDAPPDPDVADDPTGDDDPPLRSDGAVPDPEALEETTDS
ncbi:MAG: hypothetical protein RIB45_06375 [Marivibrio sp.]|uniref:hypothetical protein n=1 Tax=Marivibrio sp. TaxID=2039719 RepID=UPI0032EB949C